MINERRCARCQRRFNPEDATHYAEEVPVSDRWTCSLKCQEGIKKLAEKNKQIQEQLDHMNMSDPAEALGFSDAQEARDALRKPKRQEEPETADADDEYSFSSPPRALMAAAGCILTSIAPTLNAQDTQTMLGVALHMITAAADHLEHDQDYS